MQVGYGDAVRTDTVTVQLIDELNFPTSVPVAASASAWRAGGRCQSLMTSISCTVTVIDLPCGSHASRSLLNAELKRRGVTFAQLVQKLAEIGVSESEPNIRNELARGKFTAVFFLQCLVALGAITLRSEDA
jgi:hypothetical protein